MSSDKSKEDLVAYLDGELPDESASQVEKSLVEDAAVRRDVEQLTKTYDLLDLLPSSKASGDFTEKTLTAIRTQPIVPRTESNEGDVSDATPRVTTRRALVYGIRIAGFAGLLVAGTIGFNGAFRQNREPIDELLTELPVIQRLDQYREIGDVTFLQSLAESGLFDERDKAPED